jgi:hypothetical protein
VTVRTILTLQQILMSEILLNDDSLILAARSSQLPIETVVMLLDGVGLCVVQN